MERIELFPSAQARFKGGVSSEVLSIPSELKSVVSNAGTEALILAREDDLLWIGYQSAFKRIDLSQCRQIRLVNMTPARGPGFISIMASDKGSKSHSVIVDYDRHTDELFDEAKVLAEKIGDFLGYEIEIAYGGADC